MGAYSMLGGVSVSQFLCSDFGECHYSEPVSLLCSIRARLNLDRMYSEGRVEIEPRTYGVIFLLYLSPEFYCK